MAFVVTRLCKIRLLYLLVICVVYLKEFCESSADGNVVDGENNVVYYTQLNEKQGEETLDIDQINIVDYIEITDFPTEANGSNLRFNVNYNVAGARILVIDVYTVAVEYSKVIYHTEWTETNVDGVVKVKALKLNLPDSLVYKEDKTKNIRADLHTDYLLVRVSIVDYHQPSVLLQSAEQSITLTSPWRRLEKQGYSCSWKGMIFNEIHNRKIPTCPTIDDVLDLLPYTVALAKSEHGFKKFPKNIQFPDEEYLDAYENESPHFTVMTWLYLTKRCTNNMCPIIYHIRAGVTYLTPLIGLLESGHIHVQVHYKNDFAYAFLFDAQIPIHKWVHLAITFKGSVVTLVLRHGRKSKQSKVFVHSEFPHGMYHYNDMDGYWASGGSLGFASPQGFMGPARIYRRRALSAETIEQIVTIKSKPNLEISNYFQNCRKLRSEVRRQLKSKVIATQSCPNRLASRFNDVNCQIGLSGKAAKIVEISEQLTNNTSSDIEDSVYRYAFDLIKNDHSEVKDAVVFLTYSACLGHKQSMYLNSVLHVSGFGIPTNIPRFQTLLLIGAYHEHVLSQMALGYKYLVGVDGFPKDIDVSRVYYRLAGDTSNVILNQHNEVDTHAEVVSLDKKEDLENYRGPNSDWFTWLKHLAKQGVSDAHNALGEVFYYGARGFKRNLTKAAEYYEMGAKQGDAQMLFNLGVVKLRGHGVDQNGEEAQALLLQAAELGFPAAYNALGYYELNMRDNKSGAVHYFNRAAEKGNRDGLYNMGYAHENALAPGMSPDLPLAISYYMNAASKGHPGGCISTGDAFSRGEHVERNTHLAIVYYKFVADQIPEIGFHLRNGLDEYFAQDWYKSLLFYLLAAEAGMEAAQYNVGTLCEWNLGGLKKFTDVECMWRYYNHSALLEWVPSLLKAGDNYWYGTTVNKNITAAAVLYNKAATKNQNPQAIYNLGYLVENNYSLNGLDWLDFSLGDYNSGNLSLAAMIYKKCRDSSEDAHLPCSIGLLRVALKMGWQFQISNSEVLLIPTTIILTIFGLLVVFCRFNISQNELTNIA